MNRNRGPATMQVKHLIAAIAVCAASFAAHAEDQSFNIGLIGNSGSVFSAGLSNPGGTAVNHALSGSFTDSFSFIGYSGASIFDVWLDTSVTQGNEAIQQIIFTSATLNGIALEIDPDFVSGRTTFRTAGLSQQLTSGPLTLIVNGYAGIMGDAGRQISASYSGGVNVTPVPEPTPAALLLAGLGTVGLLVRRRRAQR